MSRGRALAMLVALLLSLVMLYYLFIALAYAWVGGIEPGDPTAGQSVGKLLLLASPLPILAGPLFVWKWRVEGRGRSTVTWCALFGLASLILVVSGRSLVRS